ncbi:TPA: hypothetical protein ACGOXQ_000001, partial [Streptococcus suis]
CVSRNELRSLYLQPPKVPQTFGASLILIFIEYKMKKYHHYRRVVIFFGGVLKDFGNTALFQ